MSQLGASRPPPAPQFRDTRTEAVAKAIDRMRGQLHEPHSLTTMAESARFSPFHFHRIFRDVTSVTPARFLAAMRMAEAKRLLLHSSLTVGEICTRVGYDSFGTFTTQFGRLVGMTPGRFRQLVTQYGALRVGQLPATAGYHPGAAPVAELRGAMPSQGRFMVGFFRTPLPLALADSCGQGPEPDRLSLTAVCPPGRYTAFALCVDAAATLAEALVDELPDTRSVGGGAVELAAGTQPRSPVGIRLRPPTPIDPPVLSVTPLLGLLGLPVEAGGSRSQSQR